MQRRFDNWPIRLDSFIRENSSRPFQYGVWDCCIFAGAAIEAMTGTDPAAAFCGRYDSAETGLVLCRTSCGRGSVEAIAASVFRSNTFEEIQPAFAQRGDVVLLKDPSALGIVALDGMRVVVVRPEGFGFRPTAEVARAWRI